MTTPNEELRARLLAQANCESPPVDDLLREAADALARKEEGREAKPYGWLEPSTGNFVDHATKLEMPNDAASFTLPIYTHPAPPSAGEGGAATLHKMLCARFDTFPKSLDSESSNCVEGLYWAIGTFLEQQRLATPTPQSGEAEGRVGEMTPERACYFLRRFKGEEKLLGPNEQWALDFAIEQLTAAGAAPEGWVYLALADAWEARCDTPECNHIHKMANRICAGELRSLVNGDPFGAALVAAKAATPNPGAQHGQEG